MSFIKLTKSIKGFIGNIEAFTSSPVKLKRYFDKVQNLYLIQIDRPIYFLIYFLIEIIVFLL